MRQGRVIILFGPLGEGQSPYVCCIAKIGEFQEMLSTERVKLRQENFSKICFFAETGEFTSKKPI